MGDGGNTNYKDDFGQLTSIVANGDSTPELRVYFSSFCLISIFYF